MKNILTLFLLIFSFQTFGQGNAWEWQNPLPQGNPINDLCFVDTLTGYAVCGNGTVIKTTNGGQTWSLKQTGTTDYYHRCQFINAQTGWAVNVYNGKLSKTNDGGSTWASQEIGSGSGNIYTRFVNEQTGWAVGQWGRIFKTSNGGSTWIQVTGVTSRSLNDVFFLNSQTGWIAGDSSTILKTTNGGTTWALQSTGSNTTIDHITFNDSLHGWAWSSGILLRTTDGGNTWSHLVLDPMLHPDQLYFSDAIHGLGSMGNGIHKTSDGGATWLGIDSFYVSELFYAIDAGHAWYVQSDIITQDKILRTSNSGETWQVLDSGKRSGLGALYFANNQTGWAVGGKAETTNQATGEIMRTTNGGLAWQTTSYGNNWLIDITFFDNLTGWIVGNSGTILKTTDGGTTWESKNSGTQAQLRSIHFVNAQNGWAVGFQQNAGVLLHSIDGGESWQTQSVGNVGQLWDVCFFDSLHGWIVGHGRLYTIDGGLNWMPMTGLNTQSFYSCVTFRNSQLGWVAGADAAMAKTTDGGLTWQNTNWTGGNRDQWDIQFTDDLNGWTVGYGMFHTSDGGTTWQDLPSIATTNLSTVFFVNNQEGWIAGGNSGILHTINSGGLTPIHKTLVSSPTFSLYPNPTQHFCHLQTTSPVLEATIIDGLGRTHLSIRNPGKTLDVQNLAQGLYWVKVTTAEGVTTQRLVKE